MFTDRYSEIAKKTLKNCKARIDTPDSSAYLISLYNRDTKAVSLEVLYRRPGGSVFTVLKTKALASDGIRELLTQADTFVAGTLDNARMTMPSEDMIDFADLSAADLDTMEDLLKGSKKAQPAPAPAPAVTKPSEPKKVAPAEIKVAPAQFETPGKPAPPASDAPAIDKAKPFGVSVSALSRWMGANGFSTEQMFQAYSDLGIATAINRNAVISYARLGRNNDLSRGPLPELAPEAIAFLNAYKKKTSDLSAAS